MHIISSQTKAITMKNEYEIFVIRPNTVKYILTNHKSAYY